MADDLPKKFDVIVVGTGLPESIIAAAFSRVGYSVLHIDRNDYYCGDWASFNLHGLDEWIQDQKGSHPDPLERADLTEVEIQEGEVLVDCPLDGVTNKNIDKGFFVDEGAEEAPVSVDVEAKPSPTPSGDYEQVSEVTSDNNISFTDTEPLPSGDGCTAAPKDDLQAETTTNTASSTDTGSTTKIGSTINIGSTTTTGLTTNVGSTTNTGSSTDTGSTTNTGLTTDTGSTTNIRSTTNTGSTINSLQSTDIIPNTNISTDEASKHTCSVEEQFQDAELPEACCTPEASCASVAEADNKVNSGAGINESENGKCWLVKTIEKEWRKFNIDLAPRLLYCRGDMVELLISSDISKYCEFKTVTRVLTYLNGVLDKVPCSRADVFGSKSVSMIEKRMMMKFITFCMDYQKHPEEYQEFADKPFTEFLNSRKLKSNIRHYIQHSIAMATEKTTTLEGLQHTQKFIHSLGRYGNTAFLWPLYGCGELPQSFARMCAVFGGIYCLRMTASSVIVDQENKCKGIVTTEGHRIECKWLVMEISSLPPSYLPSGYGNKLISRAVLLTDKPIKTSENEELSLLYLHCPDDPDRPITVLELCPSTMATPQNMYMVHLTREGGTDSPKDDLSYAVDLLLSNPIEGTPDHGKPQILWYLYYSQVNTRDVQVADSKPGNVIVMPGPGTELDMDSAVKQAKEVFNNLLPEEEFLPKAPNQEDIIFGDGQDTETGDGFHSDSPDDTIGPSEDKAGESSANQISAQSCDSEQTSNDQPGTASVTETSKESSTSLDKDVDGSALGPDSRQNNLLSPKNNDTDVKEKSEIDPS